MKRLLRGSSRVKWECVVVICATAMLLAPIAPANAGDVYPLKVAGGYGTYGPRERAEELYLDGMEKLQAGRREWRQSCDLLPYMLHNASVHKPHD